MAAKKTANTKPSRPMGIPKKLKTVKSQQYKRSPMAINWTGALADHIELTPFYDGGNGKAGLAFIHNGKFHKMTIPNARTRVRGTRVERDVTNSGAVSVDYVDFENDRWGYGKTIWDLSGDKAVETFHNTPLRYGAPEHVFYSLVMMAELGMPDGWEGWIVVSVPPGLYNQVKAQTEQGFLSGGQYDREGQRCNPDGWWHIGLSADGKTRSYKFNRVVVMMEGADATYGAYRWDLDGVPIEFFGADGQDALGGRCKILSAGFGTFDSPILVDGELIEDDIDFTSDPTGGIALMLCDPILGKIKDAVPGANITIAHVDKMLRDYATDHEAPGYGLVKGWTSQAAIVRINNTTLQMQPIFDHYIDAYANWVWTQIAKSVNQRIDVFLASGGGWLYIEKDVVNNCKANGINLLTPIMVPHLKDHEYYEVEVIGLGCFLAALVRDNL